MKKMKFLIILILLIMAQMTLLLAQSEKSEKEENLNDIQIKIIDGKKYYIIEEILAKEMINSYLNEQHYLNIIDEKDVIITSSQTQITALQRAINGLNELHRLELKNIKLQRNILIITNIITGSCLAVSIGINIKLM